MVEGSSERSKSNWNSVPLSDVPPSGMSSGLVGNDCAPHQLRTPDCATEPELEFDFNPYGGKSGNSKGI